MPGSDYGGAPPLGDNGGWGSGPGMSGNSCVDGGGFFMPPFFGAGSDGGAQNSGLSWGFGPNFPAGGCVVGPGMPGSGFGGAPPLGDNGGWGSGPGMSGNSCVDGGGFFMPPFLGAGSDGGAQNSGLSWGVGPNFPASACVVGPGMPGSDFGGAPPLGDNGGWGFRPGMSGNSCVDGGGLSFAGGQFLGGGLGGPRPLGDTIATGGGLLTGGGDWAINAVVDVSQRVYATSITAGAGGAFGNALPLGDTGGSWGINPAFDVRNPVSATTMAHSPFGLAQLFFGLQAGQMESSPTKPDAQAMDRPTAPPARTLKDWQDAAMKEAGLKPSDFDGYDTFSARNQQIMKKVYAFYATLFKNNPDFLWAGMAKLAGNAIWNGLMNPPYGGRIKSPEAIAEIMTMNKEVFLDLAGLHLAYMYGGIEEIQRLHEAGEIDKSMLEAWKLIDSGDPDKVRKGNEMLLEREQRIVLARGYAVLQTLTKFMIPVAGKMGDMAVNPIPGGKSFRELMPTGDITSFKDRWKWISTEMLAIWNRMDDELRQKLVKAPLGTPPDKLQEIVDEYNLNH
jgi:hypothetical protein